MNNDKGNASESTMDTGYKMGSTKNIPASMPAGGQSQTTKGNMPKVTGGKKTGTK